MLGWGLDLDGQASVPDGLTNILEIACGDSHSLALQSDGTVVAWGLNSDGETSVPSELTNAVAIAGGGAHSLALRADGTVLAWGLNNCGQTTVPSGLTNAIALKAGALDSLALVGLTPSIILQPQSQKVALGSDASFEVKALGAFPLSYQWMFNGVEFIGSNADTLLLD